MGQVIVTLTVTNRIDQVLAQCGFISPTEIRSCTLDDVLVDTGATLLCLPANIISQLGLVPGGKAQVETTATQSPQNGSTRFHTTILNVCKKVSKLAMTYGEPVLS